MCAAFFSKDALKNPFALEASTMNPEQIECFLVYLSN